MTLRPRLPQRASATSCKLRDRRAKADDRRHRPPGQSPPAHDRRTGLRRTAQGLPQAPPHGAGAHEPQGRRGHDAAHADQSQEHLGGHRIFLRPRRIVAGRRPDQSAVDAHARAPAVGPWAWRLEPQAGRLRSPRRAHFALRPHLPDRDAGRHEHRPDLQPGDLCRRRRIRLPDHALSQGAKRQADRRGRLAAGRRGERSLPGAGRHADRDGQKITERQRHRPLSAATSQLGAVRQGSVHRRGAQADGRRLGRPDPVPGARRRQPRADGFQHAAAGGAAVGHRAADRGHRHGTGRGPELAAWSSGPSARAPSPTSMPTRIEVDEREYIAAQVRRPQRADLPEPEADRQGRPEGRRRARSSPTAPPPSRANWPWAATCWSASWPGTASTSRTPSSSAKSW